MDRYHVMPDSGEFESEDPFHDLLEYVGLMSFIDRYVLLNEEEYVQTPLLVRALEVEVEAYANREGLSLDKTKATKLAYEVFNNDYFREKLGQVIADHVDQSMVENPETSLRTYQAV